MQVKLQGRHHPLSNDDAASAGIQIVRMDATLAQSRLTLAHQRFIGLAGGVGMKRTVAPRPIIISRRSAHREIWPPAPLISYETTDAAS